MLVRYEWGCHVLSVAVESIYVGTALALHRSPCFDVFGLDKTLNVPMIVFDPWIHCQQV